MSHHMIAIISKAFFIGVIVSISGIHGAEIVSIEAGKMLAVDCLPTSFGGSGNVSTVASSSSVKWYLSGVFVSNASQLRLPDIDHSHHGKDVRCMAGAETVVVRRIHVQQKTDDFAAQVGDTLTLTCTPRALLPGDNPEPGASWHYGGSLVSDGLVTRRNDSLLQLTLANVSVDDSGNYSCISNGNLTIKKYIVRIGLFPAEPDLVECSGHTDVSFQCRWSDVPETYLSTRVTFEYCPYGGWRQVWKDCPSYRENSCHFHPFGGVFIFRLNITNALGAISIDIPKYSAGGDYIPYPPRNLTLEALSSSELKWAWSRPEGIDFDAVIGRYRTEITNNFNAEVSFVESDEWGDHRVEKNLKYANTEYCVRMQSKSAVHHIMRQESWGPWSERVCANTTSTEPMLSINMSQTHLNSPSRHERNLRNVTLYWSVRQKNAGRYPYQGLDGFQLNVASKDQNENSTEEFIYDLNSTFKTALINTKFSYTLSDLRKNSTYLVSISAFNAEGFSPSVATTILEYPDPPNAYVVIVSLSIVFGLLLMISLLAFGFQRLENNSKPLPDPVIHGEQLKNIKPIQREHEVFDEPPSFFKEQQRRLLASGAKEDHRHSSGSSNSSGVGNDLPCEITEKGPLLWEDGTGGAPGACSSPSDKKCYVQLSTISPILHTQCPRPNGPGDSTDGATSPSVGYHSSDEGISLEECSSSYVRMGGNNGALSPPCLFDHPPSLGPNTSDVNENLYLSIRGKGCSFANKNDPHSVVDCSEQGVHAKYYPMRRDAGDEGGGERSSSLTPHSPHYSFLASSSAEREAKYSPLRPIHGSRIDVSGYVEQNVMPRIAEVNVRKSLRQTDDISFTSPDQIRVPITKPMGTSSKRTGSNSLECHGYIRLEDACYVEKGNGNVHSNGYVDSVRVETDYIDNTCIEFMNMTGTKIESQSQCSTPSLQSSPEHAVILFKTNPKGQDPANGPDRLSSTLVDNPSGNDYVDNRISNSASYSTVKTGIPPVESSDESETPSVKVSSAGQGRDSSYCIVEDSTSEQKSRVSSDKLPTASHVQHDNGYITQDQLNQMRV